MATPSPPAGRALVCAPQMPEFDRESGSRRLYNLVEFLLDAGWHVSFGAREARDGARYARLLRQRGVPTVGFGDRVGDVLRAERFDLALLAFWHVAEELLPVIRRESPATRVVVDSIDLHFLRNARQTFLRAADRVPGSLGANVATEMARELNVYAAADGVLTVSQKEADLIADFTGESDLAAAVPDCEDLPPSAVPYADRKGVVFVGNFRHAPNVGAVRFLCEEVLPRLDPGLLAGHPVSIVGNDLTDTVRGYGRDLPNVRMVGWVPSVLPYLHHARATVVPVQYGAGTKRKLVQSLLAGTPSVSTTVGVEGLHLRDGEHVLVADDQAVFADAVTRLLTDEPLWRRLAAQGRAHVAAGHGWAAVRDRFLTVVRDVITRDPKPAPPAPVVGPEGYRTLVERVREVAREAVPAGATVLVVSRGDDTMLDLGGPRGQHFPQTDAGVYAGHYPADSAAAIAHVEALRNKGAEYLLFPQTAFWWLDHYADLRTHLDRHCDRVLADANCILYRLARKEAESTPARPLDPAAIERLRPAVPELPSAVGSNGDRPGNRVLVLGVYLANQPNTVEDVVANLAASAHYQVSQKWVALLGRPPSEAVAAVTTRIESRKVPKFELVNELIAADDLSSFDTVMLFDDDIVLPERFLDRFLPLQHRFDFAIAQPARTSNSYIDHPIVEQQRGCLARQTRFVEIGPVVSFHRSIFDVVFPFDLTSPMGWGYENVWSYRLARRGLKMGIIDAVPVDHSTRKPVANYKWSEADAQRKRLFQRHEHYTYDECFRVLHAVPLGGDA
jgi:glycosyltransferase involved in cell wall biosynthesis